MIHFTVGALTKITSLGGALKHFGVSASLRRRIKHNGICTINGSPATTKDFVHEGDEVTVTLPSHQDFPPEPVPLPLPTKMNTSSSLINLQVSSCTRHQANATARWQTA